MEFLIPFLLFSFVISKSPVCATNVRLSPFKGLVCNQCQQWCANDTAESKQVRGLDDFVAHTKDGTVGSTKPEGIIDMTLIEQIIDNKIKEALQMRTCDGAKFESASSRNGSGGVVVDSYIPAVGFRSVRCDVTDDGENWTVFQRRINGDLDFDRGWADYVRGFGDLHGNFWLGLEAMYQLTKSGNIELKISMITKDVADYWIAKYSNFQIGPGSDKYKLTVSGFSGNATFDGLAYHNNRPFTTKDADHDHYSRNCASRHEGAWWHHDCANANLNGNFNKEGGRGMWWYDGSYRLLVYSEMKFRRRL